MPRALVHLIPHTHWDREWYLPLGGFRARLVGAVDELLDQLDRHPPLAGFLLDGQTVLLEDYLAVRPEQDARLAAFLRDGRISLGPWYVLADEQVPAGESLLRNLALGAADARRCGRRLEVQYSPDAFGHPAAFPALGAEFGISDGALWRGLDPALIGHRDLCWWEAPDGRRMLLYHLPPDGYEIGSNLLVDDTRLPEAWAAVAARILPRAATRHVALLVGADHHVPSPHLAALAERLAAIDADRDFCFSRLDVFLAAARAEAGELPVLRGEQRWSNGYTWSLQGVHGTRAPLKRRHGAVESLLLHRAEPLAALAPDPHSSVEGMLQRAWREVIQCQFHDAIGGCSSDLVARAMHTRLDDAEGAAAEVIRDALHRLAGHDPDLGRESDGGPGRLLLWNPVPRVRGGVVVAELSFFRRDVLVGPPGARRPRPGAGAHDVALALLGAATEGVVMPQVIEVTAGLERRDAPRHYPDQDEVDRVTVAFPLARALGGFGTQHYGTLPAEATAAEPFVEARGRWLGNGRLEAEIEPAGTFLLRGLATGVRLEGLGLVESEPDLGDTYTFQADEEVTPVSSSARARTMLRAAGPFLAEMAWTGRLRCGRKGKEGAGEVRWSSSFSLLGDAAFVRWRLTVDNRARDHRLRLRFPTGVKRTSAHAGAAFGSVARPPVTVPKRGQTAEAPFPTAPAHRWVAAAKGSRGLAILAPGFFEYEWTAAGDLVVTLLRAVGELSRGDLRARPGHAGWPTATPDAQCPGESIIELALAPITEAMLSDPDRLEQLWEDAMLPPVACWIRNTVPAEPPEAREILLEGLGLVHSALTPAGRPGAVMLRCYNTSEREVAGAWRFSVPIHAGWRTRADHTVLGAALLEEGGRLLRFRAGPRELVSVVVEWGS